MNDLISNDNLKTNKYITIVYRGIWRDIKKRLWPSWVGPVGLVVCLCQVPYVLEWFQLPLRRQRFDSIFYWRFDHNSMFPPQIESFFQVFIGSQEKFDTI